MLRPHRLLRIAAALVSFLLCSFPLLAQKVVTQDAGAGSKQESVYDAAGRIVETRTINPQGVVIVRNTFEFRPGFFVPQQTTLNYWPDTGKLKAELHVSYDANANFLSEITAVYDEAGKKIDGHDITHHVATGTYSCSRWSKDTHKLEATECPTGEEEGGEPSLEPLRLEDLQSELRMARQNAIAQAKSQRMSRKSPVHPASAGETRDVALVLPSDLRTADHVVATVTTAPQLFKSVPGLSLVHVKLPADSIEGPVLANWEVSVAGEKPQPASGSISFTVPADPSISVEFKVAGETSGSSRQVASFHPISSDRPRPSSPQVSPICMKQEICVVSGDFQPEDDFASVGQTPATIVAGSQRELFIRIPEWIVPGSQHLIIAGRTTLTAFNLCVAQLKLDGAMDSPNGDPILITARLMGPETLPDEYWRARRPTPAELAAAKSVVPGFHLTAEDSDKKSKRDEDAGADESGTILMAIRATNPAALRSAKDGMYVFYLGPDSFKTGHFVYKFVVDDGKVSNDRVAGTVMPFLARIAGQVFPLSEQ